MVSDNTPIHRQPSQKIWLYSLEWFYFNSVKSTLYSLATVSSIIVAHALVKSYDFLSTLKFVCILSPHDLNFIILWLVTSSLEPCDLATIYTNNMAASRFATYVAMKDKKCFLRRTKAYGMKCDARVKILYTSSYSEIFGVHNKILELGLGYLAASDNILCVYKIYQGFQ